MINNFLKLPEFLKSKQIKFVKNGLKNLFQDYFFFHISKNESLTKENLIVDNLNISYDNYCAVIIDECKISNEDTNINFFIIGFEKTIIITEQSLNDIIDDIYSINYMEIIYIFKNKNPNFQEEIQNFNFSLKMVNLTTEMKQVWSIIAPCISGYLINKAYIKNKKMRMNQYIQDYTSNCRPINFADEKEYIELRNVGMGISFTCSLIYHIKLGELYVIKKSNQKNLIEREKANYLKIRHPFLPKYYGNVVKNGYFVIEFIDGKTLTNSSKLSFHQKLDIIFKLMLILQYFHDKGLIYRDLKPENIIIADFLHSVVLIDFDRLIEYNDLDDSEKTGDLNTKFSAPEVIEFGKYSFKSDIYSLGKIIEYMFNDNLMESNPEIREIVQKCLQKNVEKRPKISDLIHEFISIFRFNIEIDYLKQSFSEHYKLFQKIINTFENLDSNHNDPEILFNLGLIYSEGLYVYRDYNKSIHYLSLAANQNSIKAQLYLGKNYEDNNIEKSIHYYSLAANQNSPKAQYKLGVLYIKKGLTQDIKNAIHYFSLASNQNYSKAQIILGKIYFYGKYVECNIDKAIYYFSLAAEQNDPEAHLYLGSIYQEKLYKTGAIDKVIFHFSKAADHNYKIAQYNLGVIYSNGIYVTCDMKKAIHYFSLAADNNDSSAQFHLGYIYIKGKYVARDVQKAIHYFSLSADQNDPEAQCNLGFIYYDGRYVDRDIHKAIKYLLLAADNQCIYAQYLLGVINYEGQYIVRDINCAIHYFSLAAGNNDPKSQCYLGFIYYDGRYVKRDINKAIEYFLLASNQNNLKSQFFLGEIYSSGKYVQCDMNKAIYYYSLAANGNFPDAQYNLGVIFLKCKLVQRDVKKAIHYFSLAACQNQPMAQFELGVIYYTGKYFQQDIKKGINYILQSSKNNYRLANFAHGFLLHEGKNIEKNIQEAIHYYKEASCFVNQYAKNNLGIIFKHGDGDKVKKNVSLAIEYFEEAIRKKNDSLSMYNLAHTYIFDDTIQNINKSIELLVKSLFKFSDSMVLLSLLIIIHDIEIETIYKKINQHEIKNELFEILTQMLDITKSLGKTKCKILLEQYRNKEYVYNIELKEVLLSNIQNKDSFNIRNSKAVNITSLFYEGLGGNIL